MSVGRVTDILINLFFGVKKSSFGTCKSLQISSGCKELSLQPQLRRFTQTKLHLEELSQTQQQFAASSQPAKGKRESHPSSSAKEP